MDTSDIKEIIDKKYKIKARIGSGEQANAFLVTIGENGNNCYAAKVSKNDNDSMMDNEKNILKELIKYNNPYIINYKESGEGEIIRINREPKIRKYCILEYVPNGNAVKVVVINKFTIHII